MKKKARKKLEETFIYLLYLKNKTFPTFSLFSVEEKEEVIKLK